MLFLTSCGLSNEDLSEKEKNTEATGAIVQEILSVNDINELKDKENQKQLEEYNKTLIIKYEKYLKDTKIDILQIKKKELSTNEYNDFVKELDELNIQALEDYKDEIFSKYQ